MPRGRDFLERFRPAGTPGALAARGVPADRVAELAAELAPVFALLEPVQQQSAAIRARAQAEADQRRTAARAADAQAERALAAAGREAQGVSDRVAGRLPQLAADVRAAMEARLAELLEGRP